MFIQILKSESAKNEQKQFKDFIKILGDEKYFHLNRKEFDYKLIKNEIGACYQICSKNGYIGSTPYSNNENGIYHGYDDC